MVAPLPVILLWHLHQPFYRDPASAQYLLPWARLHGVNAYTTMAILAAEYPELPLTFNLVPSLLLQLQEYAAGAAVDPWLETAAKPADELELEERMFLLRWFFLGRPETMIVSNPRYRELWEFRGPDLREEALIRAASRWTTAELRDLQVCFHLAWTSPLLRAQDPMLRGLVEKRRGYTEAEKAALLALHQETLRAVVARYRRLGEGGVVELSTSPFYHPILPLLCDLATARDPDPSLALPAEPFAHPEDARAQLERAIAYHRSCLGRSPRGLWPPEGGVSEAVLRLASAQGFKWIATDEVILHRSLERSGLPPSTLPQPAVWPECPDLTLFFRHHDLSDRIGFRYAGLRPEDAARDFVGALRQIGRDRTEETSGAIVTIALDGENPWEAYPGQGVEFLHSLYAALLSVPELRLVTPSRWLEENPRCLSLARVIPGSWIDGTFRIWAGHPEDHQAWALLARARQALVRAEAEPSMASPEAFQAAWEAVYAAEGSDWTWWYGEEHSTEMDDLFDRMFRGQIQAIYRNLNLRVPDEVLDPIKLKSKALLDYTQPSGVLRPTVDGSVSHFFEWHGAGALETKSSAMDSGRRMIRRVLYGFDAGGLWLRLDPHSAWRPTSACELEVELLIGSRRLVWTLGLIPGVHRVEAEAGVATLGVGSIIEVGIPGDLLGDEAAAALSLTLRQREVELQRIPEWGRLTIVRWSGASEAPW